jgi:SOS-response transcriptional repressor LexA
MSRYLHQDKFARCEHCGGIRGASSRPLTRKQSALYDFLYDEINTRGIAPSFEEIARAFNYASLATVHEHLDNLERKGWIKRRYNTSRAIECLVPMEAVA